MSQFLRPRWIAFHLLVITAIVVMVNLAFWQLRRHDERDAFNDRVTERIDAAPIPLDELIPADARAGDDSLEDVEWRSAGSIGRYVPDEEVVVVNRSQGGQAGDIVVTPLRLADGRLLLIERGFVPLDGDIAAPPTGEVTVTGRLRPSEERRRGQLSDPAQGRLTELQRLDLDRIADQLPAPLVPMYVELTGSDPVEAGPYPAPVSAPELTSGPHLAYAGQWFIFSACVAVGWVLAVRKSSRSRRADEAGASLGVDR